MQAAELREKYLEFFNTKSHKETANASLVPQHDPTVLFTTAGMHPLVSYLLGQKHPLGKRLVNVQRCLRTDDIDEVGDDVHLTFFEMLGNWSLGDYFKKEAIGWSYEFLTGKKWLGLEKERIAVSVFAGDADAPRDEESAGIWRSLGIPAGRIAYLPKKDNWWGPAGDTGPCGPDTEMFYWAGNGRPPERFDPADKRWVEIWNDVFMQYNKTAGGTYEPLRQRSVDTGMGLERTAAALQGKSSVYETELFLPLMKKIKSLSKKTGAMSERIIADHLRAAVFVLGDENPVMPSNVERGYVLRRLIRRAIRHARQIGIMENFTKDVAEVVIENYRGVYKNLGKSRQLILEELGKEEEKFRRTLEAGIQHFNKIKPEGDVVSGRDAFLLFQSYGFPLEMTQELAKESGLGIDSEGFAAEMRKHQELSRKAAAGVFASGLADHSGKSTRYHTATHLLNEALREAVDPSIRQRGSNITQERMRFDFNFPRKLTPEELKRVEDLVNEKIQEGLPVKREEMPLEQALASGAQQEFGVKYPDIVSVYTVGNFSREICTGPHVKNSREVGRFRIVKEEAVAAGVRRIKAIVE